MTNELNNLPFKINLPQGNKKREKIHMLIFLPKGLKIELCI